ncbi:hypothetical protein FGU65_08135, partial [Methanoculleus sp. FWC-SCC1]
MNCTLKKEFSPIHLLVWSLFTLILLGLLTAPAAAAEGALPDTVRVNATYDETTPDYGVLNFSSIQPALEAIAEGGTVIVDGGTYNGHLNVSQAVSLVTDDDAVIDAMYWGVGILICADDVSIEGFTVTNATTYGIASNLVDGVEIRDTTVTVVSGITTAAPPAGIYLNGGADHVVAENTVTVESDLPAEAGIVVWNVDYAEVSDNTVIVDAEYVPAMDAGALNALQTVPWGAGARQDEVSALDEETDYEYLDPTGIVVNGTDVLVDGNVIGVAARCLGEPGEDVFYDAYPLGIKASGESVGILDNIIDVEANATDYAYGDGIWVGGALALVEGNTITSIVTAEDAEPWGIELYDALKGRVLENTVKIAIAANCTEETYGILAYDSEKAQILDNNVTYTARIGGEGVSEVDAGIEGILVDECYQSQVAGNDVTIDVEVLTAESGLIFRLEDSGISATAAAVYADIAGEIVEGWAGATGLHIDESDEVWILENDIAVEMLLMSVDGTENVSEVYGGIWSVGMLIEDSDDAIASENVIDAGLGTGAVAIGIGENASVAYTGLFSEVFGIVLCDAEDTEISGNCVAVESAQETIAVAIASGAEGGGLIGLLDDETAEDETEMNAFAASLDEEGTYAEAVWVGLNETAFARTRTTAAAAGIYADTDGDAEIYDNTVDVEIASMIAGIAMYEVISEDAMASAAGVAQGFGIIGPGGYSADICGNTVTVESAGFIGAISGEGEVHAESAMSSSQFRITARGIVGLADENDISDNTVDVYAVGESETVAVGEIPGEANFALSRMVTRAVGIIALDAEKNGDNDISGNTVKALSLLAPTAEAEGIAGDVGTLVNGRAAGIGIRAPRASIADNSVDVLARVDNATAVATEMGALEVMSQTIAIANAQGIVTNHATVENNVVFAEGIATGTVVAETEELLENAEAMILIGATGLGIHDRALSTMTQNNVSGSALASGFGYIEGYRPEGLGIGFS